MAAMNPVHVELEQVAAHGKVLAECVEGLGKAMLGLATALDALETAVRGSGTDESMDDAVAYLRSLTEVCRAYHDDTGHESLGASMEGSCDLICEQMRVSEAWLARFDEPAARAQSTSPLAVDGEAAG